MATDTAPWRRLDLGYPRPAHLQIAERLRTAITTGQLTPGARLPTRCGLAHQYGVAPTVIADALDLLHREQLIVSHPGCGTYVRRTHLGTPNDPDAGPSRPAPDTPPTAQEPTLDELTQPTPPSPHPATLATGVPDTPPIRFEVVHHPDAAIAVTAHHPCSLADLRDLCLIIAQATHGTHPVTITGTTSLGHDRLLTS